LLSALYQYSEFETVFLVLRTSVVRDIIMESVAWTHRSVNVELWDRG